jgi:hypothetical protein
MCNQRPPLDAQRQDIWSKIYLLNYPIEFVDANPGPNQKLKDTQLKEKMIEWKWDMMNLLIKYYYKYVEEGLEYTPNIKRMIQQEMFSNDPVQEFISEYLERKDGESVKVREVITRFNPSLKTHHQKAVKQIFEKYLGPIVGNNQSQSRWNNWCWKEQD